MFQHTIFLLALSILVSGCSSVKPIGNIGPQKLPVYIISHNDFLSASRMVVILDKKGNISAYNGNVVSGAGTVALEATGALATAGAIAYGAKAIQKGLQKTIPEKITVDTNSKIAFDLTANLNKVK